MKIPANQKVDKTTIVLTVLIFLLFCHSLVGEYRQYHRRKMQEAELTSEKERKFQEQIFVNCMISGGTDIKTGKPIV